MVKRLSKFEKLWSNLCREGHEPCPLYDSCEARLTNGWCPADNVRLYVQLMSDDNLLDSNYKQIDSANFLCTAENCSSVEQLALEFLKLKGISEPPVPTGVVYGVDDTRNTIIRNLHLKACSGGVFLFENEWVVFINESRSEHVQRLTAFHEVFHILTCLEGGLLPGCEGRGHVQDIYKEILADAFASRILMPTQWVKEIWPKVQDLRSMSQIFGAPMGAVWFRLKFLGLI